jgi:hypothetical protein
MSRHQARAAAGSEWSRARLAAVLGALLVVAMLLVGGFVMAGYYALRPPRGAQPAPADRPAPSDSATSGSTAAATGNAAEEQGRRDALAAQPMRSVPLSAALPMPLSTRTPGVIVMPAPTRTGPAGVPTGFPHSPEGALAQLAAVDKAAMQPARLDAARAVIAGWAAPGGPSPLSWSGVKAMADFLTAASLSGGGSPQLALVVTPLMGLVKGTVGPDFVVACVDMEFDATLTQTLRVAVADCQRMVWAGDRWVIGPGSEPAAAPSVWPDTDTAIDVGYRDLRETRNE